MHQPPTALPGAPALYADPAAQRIAGQVFGRQVEPIKPSWRMPPVWQNILVFTNSWASVGAPYAPAAYCIDDIGVVRLRGLISTGAIGSAAFTLPAGFRPPYVKMLSSGSSSNFGMMSIDTAGVVTPFVGFSSWFSLDGVSFESF